MFGDYYGNPTGVLENDFLRLDYLTEAGPRLVRLCRKPSTVNLFAETPDSEWETVNGAYRLYGGHRLWHAPEVSGRVDVPDSSGLFVEKLSDGVRLIGAHEEPTGIRKVVEVCLMERASSLTLRHILINEGRWAVELAPWAITQLTNGGMGVIPIKPKLSGSSLQPNRMLALWPYSHWSDVSPVVGEHTLLVSGAARPRPFKIGTYASAGWAAYFGHGTCLIKRFDAPTGIYPDYGCNAEIYISDAHLELETLGPLQKLEPGASLEHVEHWDVLLWEAPLPTSETIDLALEAVGL